MNNILRKAREEYAYIVGVPVERTFTTHRGKNIVMTSHSTTIIHFKYDVDTEVITDIIRMTINGTGVTLRNVVDPNLSDADKLSIILKYP